MLSQLAQLKNAATFSQDFIYICCILYFVILSSVAIRSFTTADIATVFGSAAFVFRYSGALSSGLLVQQSSQRLPSPDQKLLNTNLPSYCTRCHLHLSVDQPLSYIGSLGFQNIAKFIWKIYFKKAIFSHGNRVIAVKKYMENMARGRFGGRSKPHLPAHHPTNEFSVFIECVALFI